MLRLTRKLIMFKPLLKRLALSSLLTCSAFAIAEQSDYKLMVINDSDSSQAIMQGQYDAVLNNTAQATDLNSQYELAFNRCAASVKSKNFSHAESLCTEAIKLLNKSEVRGYKRRELTSFALSNRGIARIMSKNDTAALSDFYEAVKMSGNDLVNHNLNRAKKNLAL